MRLVARIIKLYPRSLRFIVSMIYLSRSYVRIVVITIVDRYDSHISFGIVAAIALVRKRIAAIFVTRHPIFMGWIIVLTNLKQRMLQISPNQSIAKPVIKRR